MGVVVSMEAARNIGKFACELGVEGVQLFRARDAYNRNFAIAFDLNRIPRYGAVPSFGRVLLTGRRDASIQAKLIGSCRQLNKSRSQFGV